MQPHLFVLFNQSVGCWSAFKAPKGEVPADKPGPRSDPKSQLLVTLIFANNPAASRIFAFFKTTWWAEKLPNQSAANFNKKWKLFFSLCEGSCFMHLTKSFASNSSYGWKALLMLFAISLRSNHLKRIISATQVLTSARLMTTCHNNYLSWDWLLRETKLWLFHPYSAHCL